MNAVWRYTTINCVRVWRLYHLPVWLPPVRAAVLIGCGGFVAGQPLPAAPVPIAPYVAPYVEPAPAWLLPPVSPWGYLMPSPFAVAGYEPGPFAGGVVAPNVSSVGPCCIQPHITDHPYSSLTADVPVEPIPVPEPPALVLFLTAIAVFVGLRVLVRPANAELRGPAGLISWGLLCVPWPVAVWWLL